MNLISMLNLEGFKIRITMWFIYKNIILKIEFITQDIFIIKTKILEKARY